MQPQEQSGNLVVDASTASPGSAAQQAREVTRAKDRPGSGVAPESSGGRHEGEARADFWRAARTVISLADQASPLVPVSREKGLPLSAVQQRIWFLNQAAPDDPSYNIPFSWHVLGDIDVRALEHSFNAIIERHEILRTVFTEEGGVPAQVISPYCPLVVPVLDLEALPEPEREQVAFQHMTHEFRRPFDLAQGPLLRSMLLRMAGHEHILLIV